MKVIYLATLVGSSSLFVLLSGSFQSVRADADNDEIPDFDKANKQTDTGLSLYIGDLDHRHRLHLGKPNGPERYLFIEKIDTDAWKRKEKQPRQKNSWVVLGTGNAPRV